MKVVVLPAIVLCIGLSACNKPQSTVSSSHGRYVGVGLYSASGLWARMTGSDQAEGPTARLADDDTIIVTVDSQTGEVRQCGNLSGYCITQNPWTKNAKGSPVSLTRSSTETATKP